MRQVISSASMSLDGYIAKADNTIGHLFDWLQNGDVEFPTASPDITLHLTAPSAAYLTQWVTGFGALVCGRTLFDLQSTTEKVKERTAHLVGVKIAIMGCVVNGPGEMADADFGYVGGAPGKVNLYVGKECMERNVPEEEAADRLVDLIKARGRWAEESADQDQEIA